MDMPLPTGSVIRGSVCPHDCPSTCALDVEVIDGNRIGAVRGADNPYTAGVVCAKVARYADRIHHPDRLLYPMRRTGPKGSGAFTRIGWDEALGAIAAAFTAATAQYGAEAVWPFNSAGTMGLVNRDGLQRLTHVMGYSRRKSTICTAIALAGWGAGVGRIAGPDPREMAASDLIVIWGGNPVATQVNAMSHITRARKQRGAKLVVIDPYRTGTAAAADMHLAPRPGTDGALACAVMHVVFRDGYADRDYMARYADDPAALEAHVATRGPDWAAGITGIPAEQIEAFAALYGSTRRAFIRCGFGFTRSRNGATNLHAVTCLPTVTGAWAQEGGGAFWMNRTIYHWDKTLIEGLDRKDSAVRELDMSRIGPILTGDRSDLGNGPQVHAMLIQSTNIAATGPDTNRVHAGLLRDDLFVAVHDQFMTDTARLADIVLPATMFLEHDDVYQAGGHSHIQIGAKLIEPPGECRSNHEVVCALAARLGAEHPGFGMASMAIVDATLQRSRWPSADRVQAARWVDAQVSFNTAHFIDGFGHPDGRFHFVADWKAIGPDGEGMPSLPDHWDATDAATAEHPFRMVAAPARQFLNSTFTQMAEPRRREVRPTVLLHPEDAARLGVAEGDAVEIGNAQGVVSLHARVGAGLQPGVVVVESVWPGADFAGGVGINALISAKAAAPAGGAVFHDTAVWVRAALTPALSQSEKG
jgi:anaerobic selenocysteine-containing dehydrogenase